MIGVRGPFVHSLRYVGTIWPGTFIIFGVLLIGAGVLIVLFSAKVAESSDKIGRPLVGDKWADRNYTPRNAKWGGIGAVIGGGFGLIIGIVTAVAYYTQSN